MNAEISNAMDLEAVHTLLSLSRAITDHQPLCEKLSKIPQTFDDSDEWDNMFESSVHFQHAQVISRHKSYSSWHGLL